MEEKNAVNEAEKTYNGAKKAYVKALKDRAESAEIKIGEIATKLIASNITIRILEHHLAEVEKLTDKLCNSQPDPYDDAYSDAAPWLTMRRQIGRELKKALRGVVGESEEEVK